MATTPNYGWVTPAPTDFVTDLPADFETFADAVDADLAGLLGGTTGQVLTKDSATDHDFSWQTPAPASSMTQLATGSLSGAQVDLTSIAGTYRSLRLVVLNYRPATDGALFQIRFNADTGTNYYNAVTANYVDAGTFSASSIFVNRPSDNGASKSLMIIDFPEYANTTTWKFLDSVTVVNDETNNANFAWVRSFGLWNNTNAISQLNLFNSSGNFTSGSYVLYGVQ